MTKYAVTNSVTNIFEEEDSDSDLLAQIDPGTSVAVVQHGCVWSKIIKDLYEGYCKTEHLNFENKGEPSEKESLLMISIPRDCACALYNALKFSLKL